MNKFTIPQFALNFFALSILILVLTNNSLAQDCNVLSFEPSRHFSNGSTTVRTAIADFNNDGKPDVAATAHDAHYVGVFFGDGTGNFGGHITLAAGGFSVPVSTGDFNGDGNQDLAVGSNGGYVWIYLGNGAGGFSAPALYAAGGGEAYEMAVADFNSDGTQDLAIGHQFGALNILLGTGNGGFTIANSYLSNAGPVLVKKADFNNDGKTDLITTNQQAGNITILLGSGNGSFTVTTTTLPLNGFMIGDFNNDGKTDVVSGASDGVTLLLSFGDGFGGLNAPTSIPTGPFGDAKEVDLNGDGRLDFAMSNGSTGMVSIFLQNSAGEFDVSGTHYIGNGPGSLNIADFNLDGKPDMVAPTYYGGDISVLINQGFIEDTTPPTISAPSNITTTATSTAGTNVEYSIPADDNSGIAPTLSCDFPSGSFFPLGTTTVTCSAVDTCGNHSANVGFLVTVTCDSLDLSPLGDIQVDATNAAGAVVNFGIVQNVASVNFSVPSGSTFAIGTTTVNYTVTEYCGNTVSGSFQVTVVDSPPVLTLPTNIYTNATSSLGKVVVYPATATDAVSGNLALNCDHASGDTFPIGQTVVNCSATDGAGNNVSGSFTINVFGCIGCIAPEFTGMPNVDLGAIPGRIAAADFNRDGKLDLAVTSPDSSFVGIFLGQGNGNFNQPTILPAGGFSVPVSVGDFNRDNNPDLAVGSWDGVVWIYIGNGVGGFAEATYYPAGGGEAYEMVVDDFNRDGKQDLAIVHQFAGLDVLLGDGNGGFAEPVEYLEGLGPVQIRATDFNNDGKTDLVTSNAQAYNVSILLGDGAGGFTVNTLNSLPGNNGICPGDFNGDAKIDLIVKGDDDSSVSLLIGNGQGGFSVGSNYQTGGNGIYNIKAADFNRDGKLDFAVMNVWSNIVSVFSGDGQGTFGAPFILQSGSNPVDLHIADLNNDGKPDIQTANYGDYNFSVYLNSTVLQTAATQTGSNVAIQTIGATLTFDNVTTAGTTTVTPIIDPAAAGETPGGFALSESIAFEVTTTATFSGPVTTCFNVPSVNDMVEFDALRILHRELNTSTNQYTLVDRTASHDYPNRRICATTTSFSPFYLATVSKKVRSLFDRSRAFKSGSTIPVKLQILNQSSQNISAATMFLTARGLRRIGSNTTSTVTDAGNSNPDFTFRYDSGLQGYIYNLKTTGVAAGRYVLSFYAGNDRSFFYTVEFEVK